MPELEGDEAEEGFVGPTGSAAAAAAAPGARPGVHDSFLSDAIKVRDRRRPPAGKGTTPEREREGLHSAGQNQSQANGGGWPSASEAGSSSGVSPEQSWADRGGEAGPSSSAGVGGRDENGAAAGLGEEPGEDVAASILRDPDSFDKVRYFNKI